MPPKSVALVGAICVTMGWLLASTVSPPVARVQSRPQPQQSQPQLPDASQFAEQLRLRIESRERPTAPVHRRNPFVFATREPAEVPPSGANALTPEPEPTLPALDVSGPAYTLSGIGISGEVRSAVLANGQDVYIVKAGDAVGGFTVVEITDDSVTLEKDAERVTLRFAQ
jgi:Tfp pilus assembly protein PilP